MSESFGRSVALAGQSTSLASLPGPISNAPVRCIYQTWAVARLTLRNLILSKRTILMLLLSCVPVAIAAVVRYWLPLGAGRPVSQELFTGLFIGLYVYFVILLMTIFYGTSLIAEERSDRTITFLQSRPVRRELIVLGKFSAYAASVTLMLLCSLGLTYAILSGMDGDPSAFHEAVPFARYGRVVVLAVLAYGALFTFFGATFNHPVIAAFFYCFAWESILPYLPVFLKKGTLMHYVLSLGPNWTSKGEILGFFVQPTPPERAAWTLLGICVAFMVLTAIALHVKEYKFEKEL